ncbi:MAG: selenium metabolism-associated LysR family transcriptional regulator [Desulfobacterota bacterium]|nr:selenium metabolism-associated LysR family transcriptional regulator [Thermodesulfobacteriota bacterium]
MKINQIEIFCKVIELGGFSKAANFLHLTQPTITEHIKSLEDYLGTTLIDRLGREVVPTRMGIILYEYAQKILKLKVEAEQKIKALTGKLEGELVVGASNIPGEFILPHLMKSFKKNFPDIFIVIEISDTGKVIENLLANRIELGIVGAILESSKLEYHKFIKDELVLVVSSGSPWSKFTSITREELKKIPFILREEGSGTMMTMEKAFYELNFNPRNLNTIMRLGSTTAVIKAIKTGIGASILSRRAVEEDINQGMIKSLAIEKTKMFRDFYIAVRRGKSRSPLGEAFLKFLITSPKTELNIF